MNSSVGSRRVVLAVVVLSLVAAYSLVWPTYRSRLDIEIDVNEGWNAHFADAALGPEPLYPPRDRFITNNYPPLSFYLVGGVGRMTGDPLLAGRRLSLAAVVAIAAGVGLTIRELGGAGIASAAGAMYYLATMCVFFTHYVGMNDPQLIGQAVMTAGLVVFLRAAKRDHGYTTAFLLMIAAGFIKHNLVVVPLACLIWVRATRPRRLTELVILSVVVIAGGFAVCRGLYGPDFFANLLDPRAVRLSRGLAAADQLATVGVGLVVWAYVGWARRADPGVRFCNLLVALGVGSFFYQKCGAGVDCNAQFELVFGVAVGVGLTVSRLPSLPLAERHPAERLCFRFLLALLLPLALLAPREPVRLVSDSRFRDEIASREAATADTVARIRGTPGDVYSSAFACHRAGKPFVVDDFSFGQRVLAGRLPPDALHQLVIRGRLTIVIVDPLAQWKNR